MSLIPSIVRVRISLVNAPKCWLSPRLCSSVTDILTALSAVWVFSSTGGHLLSIISLPEAPCLVSPPLPSRNYRSIIFCLSWQHSSIQCQRLHADTHCGAWKAKPYPIMQISTCETNDVRDCRSDFIQKEADGDTVHASSPLLLSNRQNQKCIQLLFFLWVFI